MCAFYDLVSVQISTCFNAFFQTFCLTGQNLNAWKSCILSSLKAFIVQHWISISCSNNKRRKSNWPHSILEVHVTYRRFTNGIQPWFYHKPIGILPNDLGIRQFLYFMIQELITRNQIRRLDVISKYSIG